MTVSSLDASRPIRVLVVEDSAAVRAQLCEVLDSDSSFEVVGSASSGPRALELCAELRPDVMTVDLTLPGMDGLELTEQVMVRCPTPILVVASAAHRSELHRAYSALAAGAVDLLERPRAYEFEGVWEWQLRSALIAVAKIGSTGSLAPREEQAQSALSVATGDEAAAMLATHPVRVLAIGASAAGGPAALVHVLNALPASYSVPVLVVLHLAEPFSTGFAEWLDAQTSRRVTYAQDREPLDICAGRVTLAPAGRHLSVAGGRLRLIDEAERGGFRPSLDLLLESLASAYGSEVAACLLSGAGCDGAEGLLAVRKAGGITFVQREDSCVARAMPLEAQKLGAVERSLSLPDLASALARLETPEDSLG